MQDLFLSYAGEFGSKHPIHTELRQLNAGDAVDFVAAQGELRSRGQAIARLSRKGREKDWQCIRDKTVQGRILALLQRRNEDSEAVYQNQHRCEQWEVPIVELAWVERPQAG